MPSLPGQDVRSGSRTWYLFFALATLGAVLVLLGNAGSDPRPTLGAIGLLLVGQAFYWIVTFATRTRGLTRRLAGMYVSVAIVTYWLAAGLDPWAQISVTYLTPQLFMLLSSRVAAAGVVLLSAGQTLVRITLDVAVDLTDQVGTAVFVVTFSLFLGSRMHTVAVESAERLRLIQELRRREEEVSALAAARAAEEERARIARDMHDTLAQGFASIIVLGHAIRGELVDDRAAAGRHLDMIVSTAQDNLEESRRIIHALSPARLMHTPLTTAIQRLAQEITQETGIDATLDITGDPWADPSVDVVTLRVVQESLANIRRHAHASHLQVALAYAAEDLHLGVSDDGHGFSTAGVSSGFGIAGMKSRVADRGGTVQITSAVGEGTVVRARIPRERS